MSLGRHIKRPRSESPDGPSTALTRPAPAAPSSAAPQSRPPSTRTSSSAMLSMPAAGPLDPNDPAGPDFAAFFQSPTARIVVTSANSASTAYHLHVDPLASASSVLQAHFATPPPRRSAHPTNHNIAYLAQIPAEYIDDVFPFFIEYVYKGRYRLPGDLSPAERARALFKISVMGSLLGVQRMRLTAIEQLAEVLRTWEVRDDVQDVARVCNLIYIVFDARPMGLRVGYTDPHAPSPPSPPAPQQAVPVAPSSPGRDGRVQGDIGLAIRGLGPPLPMRDREMEQRRMDEEDMKRVRWLEKQRLPQRMLVAKWAAGMKTMLWKWEEFRCCVRNAESGFETFFVENLGDGQGVVSGELDHEVYRKYL